MRRIGVLMGNVESDPAGQSRLATFRGALSKLGWTDGSNLRIEVRWGGADPALFARYAAELIALSPEVLLADTSPSLEALRQQTRTIPIVFVVVADPIGQGFVPQHLRMRRLIAPRLKKRLRV
jgi:putative ABC transport system substrate-binding protein